MPLMKLSPMRWAAIVVGTMALGVIPGAASAAPQSPVEAGLRVAGDLAAAGVRKGLTALPSFSVDDDRDRRGDRRGNDRGRRDDRGDRRGNDRRYADRDRRDDRSRDRRDRRDDRYDHRRDRRDDRWDDRRDRRDDRWDDRRDRRYVNRDDRRRYYNSGRRYDYGHRHGHGPRRGHGYYCNDHFAFHYYSGYDPYGWRRASYRGYYPPRGCYLVERVEYRRGRRVLVGGYSCLDPYGYAYIQLGSQFVLRYY